MQQIMSVSNQKVKDWKKLNTKKGRAKQGKYLLDGWHLVQEVLKSKEEVLEVLVVKDSKYYEQLSEFPGITYYEISAQIAKALSDTPSPQGIFATVRLNELNKTIPTDLGGAWLLLDEVQDPGNIGTMVRTADAAGFRGVVFGNGTADMYQPKVVRSMQGSQFHIEILSGDLKQWIPALQTAGLNVYGTELNKFAKPYDTITKQTDFALVMGNEGNGMHQDHLSLTTNNLYIPIVGGAESLNVAVAAGVMMFQLKARD